MPLALYAFSHITMCRTMQSDSVPMTLKALLNFDDIDRERDAHGISKAELCRSAKVHVTTYNRWKNGLFEPTTRTMRRLREALAYLLSERHDDDA
jgi:ribosome-binding protein aMBF1 (putative translation factor)